eukprot:TRINITY_DN4509_c0_g1_i1.p1 TRINITY_DN4509_c0_g1~~TRINITY_DN4509_c0_g1_i1.p1  ORF type:complete len:604 (-),score=49.50 TRINITY_DN4509_c0_g1_i1:217-2028(-)
MLKLILCLSSFISLTALAINREDALAEYLQSQPEKPHIKSHSLLQLAHVVVSNGSSSDNVSNNNENSHSTTSNISNNNNSTTAHSNHSSSNKNIKSQIFQACDEPEIVARISQMARAQSHNMRLGAKLLGKQANAIGAGVLHALSASAWRLKDGDLHGALLAGRSAISDTQATMSSLDAEAAPEASRGACVILVFIFVALCWFVEFALSKWTDTDADVHEDEDGATTLHSLGFLRFILSWLVVLNSWYPWTAKGVSGSRPDPFEALASWGLIAVPLFFLLSGFCHSYSKLTGPMANVEEGNVGAMVSRVMVWYPFYLLVLIWCSVRWLSYNAGDWSHFMASAFLFQGVLWGSEVHYPFLPQTWWLCYLAVYLLIWPSMHYALEKSSNSVLWTMFIMSTMATLPSVLSEAFFFSDNLIFECMQYIPTFCFGQSLAVWYLSQHTVVRLPSSSAATASPRRTLIPANEFSFAVRYGVTVSAMILGTLIFSVSLYGKLFGKVLWWSVYMKGLLLPVFAMLVAGLAAGIDPLAKLAARPPLRWSGKLSMSTYLLQLPVHSYLEDLTGWTGFTWTFVLSLFAASIAGHYLIERPSRMLVKMYTSGGTLK